MFSKQFNFINKFLPNGWLRLGVTWCLFLASGNVYAQLPIAEEYQVKAVFLYNFASFITWPATTFINSSAPFNICVLGEDPFGEELDFAVEDEAVEGHPVKVQRFRIFQLSVTTCQIVFISQSEKYNLAGLLTQLQQRPILLVSDIAEFVSQGGMVEFFKQGKKVRFLIDRINIKNVRLEISGDLLRIAKLYR